MYICNWLFEIHHMLKFISRIKRLFDGEIEFYYDFYYSLTWSLLVLLFLSVSLWLWVSLLLLLLIFLRLLLLLLWLLLSLLSLLSLCLFCFIMFVLPYYVRSVFVLFRLGGTTFPPKILFKIYIRRDPTIGGTVKYLSAKEMIAPSSLVCIY